MKVLSITHGSNRILIVIRLQGKDEESKAAELRRLKKAELQEYSCNTEGNIASGFCNIIIALSGKTEAEMQEECCKLYRKLYKYISEDYALE